MIKGGPKIETDGLVLYYDVDNVDSYPGEPTTNILPSPTRNGDFTTSTSQWATYNTNQYNGNNYFSIGTIDNITDNIVTLSAVGRAINSFDVLNPNATGGGVTSGTGYFIKKLSSTQFTLHAYNGSQDGTQGYINSATGGHKVHDSVWLDTRIAISLSGFPTMWKGNPHVANSAIVKEIRYGGGRRPNTNCMRCHKNRDINVRDGMAYGVNTPTTIGVTYTLTFWVKAATPNAIGKTMNWSSYFGSGFGSFSKSVVLTGNWQQASKTFVSTNTYSFISYWWFTTGDSDVWAYDICDIQVEQKDHSTPWTSGTRSTTDGLKDLSGNDNHADLANAAYDSNALIDYDGAGGYSSVGASSALNITTTISAFAWVKPDDLTLYNGILGSYDSGAFIHFQLYNSSMNVYVYGPNVGGTQSAPITAGIYNCVGLTFDGTTLSFYCDGVFIASLTASTSFTTITDATTLSIGRVYSTDRWFNGKIDVVKIYDNALTPKEILDNFNAQKSRFGR